MSVDLAWQATTGRPDVVIAVLDSGIHWDDPDVRGKVHLRRAELPLPWGHATYDADGNGVLNVLDYEGDPRANDANGNGFLDAQDLLRAFSDGVDDDGNGYVDDIAGWNAMDDTNDAGDDVRYGHGTGEAKDSTAEADNAAGLPGTCPNCMFLPVRVGMSFIAAGDDYAAGVLYSVAAGASVIQEALGTVDASPLARAAAQAAEDAGIPVIASAADEAAYHHNMPSALEHAIVVNSVTRADVATVAPASYLYLNGCTNFGANMAVAVSSTSCSSEATGRSAGIAGLLESAARNAVDRGALASYPGIANALSANEVRQLFTMTADDIDFSGRRQVVAAVPTLRYPSGPGFDTYFGYGRLNADAAVRAVAQGRIPPEAEIQTPTWWQPVDPAGALAVRGLAAAVRSASFGYTLDAGCGLAPDAWTRVAQHEGLTQPLRGGVLGTLDLAATAARCDAPGARAPTLEPPLEPNEWGVTLRLRVTDAEGRVGEHRKYFFLHRDPDLLPGFPLDLRASGEQSPRMADIDGDGRVELVVSTDAGDVHVLRADGSQLPGFPVRTFPADRATGRPPWNAREPILHGGVAIADLDGDERPELVASTYAGRVYVWGHDGVLKTTMTSDPAWSRPELRDRYNRLHPGFVAAPVLADLDGDGTREIVQAGLDRHLYVWRHDGTPVPGFPRLVVDTTKVHVDPLTHKVRPRAGDVLRGTEIVSTPAVADLDGDGLLEIVVGHNEEYAETPDVSATSAPALFAVGRSGILGAGNGRLHAIRADGTTQPGWPVRIADLATEILPTVGEGIPGSPSIADVDGDGTPEIAIFSTVGPAYLLRADGTPYYGRDADGRARTMTSDGAAAPASDQPVLPGLGTGVLADLGGGRVHYYAPASGLTRALDVALVGEQVGAVDYVMGWDARTGAPLPGWPRVIEDLQFLTSPIVVDLDGDGRAEVVQGSAGYYLHAYDAVTGIELAGWPKSTGGWIIASAAVGDLDGDGANEVAVTTREGHLYVWRVPGKAGGIAPWPTIHHDNANTGNAMPTRAPGAVSPAPAALPVIVPLLALGVALRRR